MRTTPLALFLTGMLVFALPASASDPAPTESAAQATTPAWTCPMHPDVVKDAAGDCPTCGMKLVEAKAVYTCPMHTDVRRSQEGTCSKCGMKLVPTADEAAEHHHDAHGNE